MTPTHRAKLSDIVNALEIQSDESEAFLHIPTGKIITTFEHDDYLDPDSDDESESELQDWQREIREERLHLDNNRGEYLTLPSKYDINEWSVMEDFVQQLSNAVHREVLTDAIHGKGAFSRFKQKAEQYGILSDWYKFLQAHYVTVAKEWAEANSVVLET